MTDEEIREAMACCMMSECQNCPNKGAEDCAENLIAQALGLILRINEELEATIAGQETLQKALVEKDREVAELNSDLKLLRNDYDYLKEKFDKAIEKNINQRDKILKLISERNSAEAIRAEAVREFAERLKEEMHKYCGEITEDDINNLVKKMVGED